MDTIQAVIADQLRAFEAKDPDAAFANACHSVQSRSSTPEKSGRMVATRYTVIGNPGSYEMLDFFDTAMGPVQIVLLQDAQGRSFEAALEGYHSSRAAAQFVVIELLEAGEWGHLRKVSLVNCAFSSSARLRIARRSLCSL
jgi:hypothetical protein